MPSIALGGATGARGGAVSDPDPRCPACGEPIGQTATYCMHCSADLPQQLEAADDDGDWRWDQGDEPATGEPAPDEQMLDSGRAGG